MSAWRSPPHRVRQFSEFWKHLSRRWGTDAWYWFLQSRASETKSWAKMGQWEKTENPVRSEPSHTPVFFLFASFNLFPKHSEVSQDWALQLDTCQCPGLALKSTGHICWGIFPMLQGWGAASESKYLSLCAQKGQRGSYKTAFKWVGNKVRLSQLSFLFFFFLIYWMKMTSWRHWGSLKKERL